MSLRSLLFVPGDSEKKLAKAESVGADALILDLEDAVAAAHKATARTSAAAFVTERASHLKTQLYVRINPLDSGLAMLDLAAVVANRVLPELFARGEEEIFDRLPADAPGAGLHRRDVPAVARPGLQGLEHEQVERALQQFDAILVAGRRHGYSHSIAMDRGCLYPWPRARTGRPTRCALSPIAVAT